VEDRKVEKVYLIGSMASDESLGQAVQMSKIPDSLADLETYQVSEVVAVGAATLAKNGMEWHKTDCTEPWWCEKIRKEADRIAGQVEHPSHVEL